MRELNRLARESENRQLKQVTQKGQPIPAMGLYLKTEKSGETRLVNKSVVIDSDEARKILKEKCSIEV